MKKEKILLVANWKMNPETVEKAKEIFKETRLAAKNLKKISVVVCAPFVYLSDLEKVNNKEVILGAQDMFWEESGSFTGEISSKMLKSEGYVILGHSERRNLGETDEMVAKKVALATKSGLQAILCVGESNRDEHGEYLHFLRQQIIQSVGKLGKRYTNNLVIAYEPIWAIGKSGDQAMKPTNIHEAVLFIKKILVEIFGQNIGMSIPILYGGSVDNNNAKEIVTLGGVQGLLIGRESLNTKKFGELLRNVNQP